MARPVKPPRPRRQRTTMVLFGLLTLGLCAALYAYYHTGTQHASEPRRGYTPLGLLFGAIAAGALVFVFLYAWRKRAGQEWLPGRLQTWLRVHIWLSCVALWASLLHAGFHLDDTLGAVTAGLAWLTILTGCIGLWFYLRVPARVAQPDVGNLAMPYTRHQIEELERELEESVAGRSEDLQKRVRQWRRYEKVKTGALSPEEQPIWKRAKVLVERIDKEQNRLAHQGRLRFWLRAWVWLHVPLAILFGLALVWHVVDALEVEHDLRAPSPTDFSDPMTCAKCHQSQFEEWASSMHASAMMAPTVELQHKLVIAKERRDIANGAYTKPIVGDLCVRCHAPTTNHPSMRTTGDVLGPAKGKHASGRWGISCVTCHQIETIHPTIDNDPDPEDGPIHFRNANNLTWRAGRIMRGPLGSQRSDEDVRDAPSAGNSEHEGRYAPHFDDPAFCASCHTVTTDDPHTGKRLVKLQDTYREWLDGDKKLGPRARPFSWAEEPRQIRCMDCHNRDLTNVVKQIDAWGHGKPLEDRFQELRRILQNHKQSPVTGEARTAVAPGGESFDSKVTRKRRYLHTFVGVDHTMEPAQPLGRRTDMGITNVQVASRMKTRTTNLLKMAAQVRVRSLRGRELEVGLLNLGTGHKLPAGFAFARELWVEVSVGGPGNRWQVVLGGDGRGGSITGDTPLRKKEEGGPNGLRNLQAVLFDTANQRETVLQNEAGDVLAGAAAVKAGFRDREAALQPGEIRVLKLRLPANWRRTGGGAGSPRIRVRLRFRNFPPAFLQALHDRLKREHASADNPAGVTRADIERAAKMRSALYVIDMDEDIVRIR